MHPPPHVRMSRPNLKAKHTTMKLKHVLSLLAASLLAVSAPAQTVGIKNIVNSTAGISYNANAVTVTTSTYTAAAKDHTINVDASAAAVTITLPPVSQRSYPFLVIKKIDSSSNTVTIDPNGSETIDGGSTVVLRNRYQTVILHADDTTWRALATNRSSGPVALTPGSTVTFAPDAVTRGFTLTPAQSETINATTTNAVKDSFYTIKVTTSGTSSYTLTFGTNFKTTGTLATGTTSGKVFTIVFYFDGSTFVETARTTAM